VAGIVDFGHVRPGRARDGETFPSILPTAFGTGVMPICEGLLVHVSTGRTCPLTVIAWRLGALPLAELWWRYVGLGGNLQRDALVDYLSGTASWPAFEHNVLAHVLNERLWELGCPSLAPNRTSDDHRRGVGSQAERGLRDAP
jgi:hypothetical protein